MPTQSHNNYISLLALTFLQEIPKEKHKHEQSKNIPTRHARERGQESIRRNHSRANTRTGEEGTRGCSGFPVPSPPSCLRALFVPPGAGLLCCLPASTPAPGMQETARSQSALRRQWVWRLIFHRENSKRRERGRDKMLLRFSYCNGYLFCLESTHHNASG